MRCTWRIKSVIIIIYYSESPFSSSLVQPGAACPERYSPIDSWPCSLKYHIHSHDKGTFSPEKMPEDLGVALIMWSEIARKNLKW